MKILIAISALILTFAHVAQAKASKQIKNCAFGESSYDLKQMLKYEGKNKVFYESEHLSLSRPERLLGLNETERLMIQLAMKDSGSQFENQKEMLEGFQKSEGYITYFSHNSNGREFAIVASYPGDNEYGLVIELNTVDNSDFNRQIIVGVSASIQDGDIYDCAVEYEKP